MFYTVTGTVTAFIKAEYSAQAEDILHEALLGNDPHKVLEWSEVDGNITSRRGVHYTTCLNDGSFDYYQLLLDRAKIESQQTSKENEMDTNEMHSAMVRAIMADRDKWRDMADMLADAIQDLHHMIPSLEKVTGQYLDLCDGDIDG